ncbi:MAG TPA: GNAT family N-acetyltransferase [Pyrinomonadaceae bacterium]|jgi:ribosomal-protein-alanine N-acetyltransferase|nr:GNAT family N-acetyltransferase [Pyrinomonadaceae bacterium]
MIETDRLSFRPFTLDDLPLLIEQRSDPDMNRYLGGPRRQNPEELAKRIRFYMSCYESHGFGMCPMFWKETGEMIGAAGIQPLEDTGEIEVGYSVIKEFWRRGIATESARGWMEFGFNKFGLERIVAVAVVENTASRHVMDKLGMSYEKTESHYGEECAFYAISKKEFFKGVGHAV